MKAVAQVVAGAVVVLAWGSTMAQETRDAAGFAEWRQAHREAVATFEQHLGQAGVGELIDLHELLRSASSWQDCRAEPYAVPPMAQWPAAVRVLQLIQRLVASGVLRRFEVHSTYRDAALNACAGGASGSAHLRSFAIDFTPIDPADPTDALCRFWRAHGRDWAMGLGRYATGRIHVDTMGHRRWGALRPGESAVCSDIESTSAARP